jgi:serine/threonine-protein kinase
MLDHYRLIRHLGDGGYGQVYEAWDTQLCRRVALKQLKHRAPGHAGRLVHEARLAASLEHRAFVKVLSVIGAGDTQSIVMELVHGSTLRQCIQEGRIGAGQALDIVAQVAEAMMQAHASGLVHGDLKPSNLMIEADGRVRILDFGLARQIDPLATESVGLEENHGTIAYMAPERLRGQPPCVQTDVYALGVLLYEMVTGARPFPALNGLALAAAHLQTCPDRWPVPAGADRATIGLVHAMTAHQADQRPASMAAVGARVRALQQGQVPAATTAGRWRAAARELARARTPLLAVALTLGLGLALWGTLEWTPWRQAPLAQAGSMQQGMDGMRQFDRDGSLERAISNFTAVLEHEPRRAAAAAGLALAYALRYTSDGRDPAWLALADASAQQALLLDDQLALGHAAQGDVRRLQQRNAEALACYERALRLDPLDRFALLGKGNLFIATSRLEEAGMLIARAILAYPAERRFADQLGTLRFKQGDYRAAEAAFRHSLEIEPDAAYAYANLSAALLRQDRGVEALQVLQQGLQARPNGRLYGNLGTSLFARGDYAGAARAFEQAVSSAKGDPGDYLKWANLADALHWIPGREAAARQGYRRAQQLIAPLLAAAPNDSLLASRMGLYCAHLGQPQEAVRWSALALERAPADRDVQFRAGVAAELGGRRDAAIAALARARALGYPANLIDSDPFLIALRRDPRYQITLLENAR